MSCTHCPRRMNYVFHSHHLLHCQILVRCFLLFCHAIFLVEMQFLFCAPPLSVTEEIVYSPCGVGQVRRPVFFPCCGVSVREKHVLLHLVTDMAIEEGQSNPNSRKENHQKGNA